jgi:putative acyl-CoA dehydrogenase
MRERKFMGNMMDARVPPRDRFETHEVDNQPPALDGYSLYAGNCALQEALAREGAGWAHGELTTLGTELGTAEWIKRGDDANRNPPAFKPFDRFGHRRDEFEFHPAWHECMRWLKHNGVDTGAWADPGRVHTCVVRRCSSCLPSQCEAFAPSR